MRCWTTEVSLHAIFFTPQQIITDESVKKPQTQELSGDDVDKAFASLGEIVRRGAVPSCE